MQRVVNSAEHNLFADPPRVITLAAGVAAEIFPNEQGMPTSEIAYRYFQNTGAGDLWFSFGITDSSVPPGAVVDASVLHHGKLSTGSQVDCSNHRLRVCAISTAGTTVATTLIRRDDI